jgi:hypothetical protein
MTKSLIVDHRSFFEKREIRPHLTLQADAAMDNKEIIDSIF